MKFKVDHRSPPGAWVLKAGGAQAKVTKRVERGACMQQKTSDVQGSACMQLKAGDMQVACINPG
jgi:hypothetical protein